MVLVRYTWLQFLWASLPLTEFWLHQHERLPTLGVASRGTEHKVQAKKYYCVLRKQRAGKPVKTAGFPTEQWLFSRVSCVLWDLVKNTMLQKTCDVYVVPQRSKGKLLLFKQRRIFCDWRRHKLISHVWNRKGTCLFSHTVSLGKLFKSSILFFSLF